MDTDSADLSKSQYMQSYWFSNKSNINIIYNISVITITITMSIILANFGKYPISDCPFIITCQNLILASMMVGHVFTCQNYHFGKYVGWSCLSVCLFVTCQNYHFGKYVCWSCLLLAKIYILASMFIGRVCYLSVCLFVCTEISQNLKNDSISHHQTWSQASTSPWFLQVRWTRM